MEPSAACHVARETVVRSHRPTSFYWEKLPDHPGLCSLAPHSQCVAAVTSLGNPLIWWLGSLCALGAIAIVHAATAPSRSTPVTNQRR